MTLRCKPGDVAYIVPPYEFREALGRVVTVRSVAIAGHKSRCPDGGFIEWVPDRYFAAWICEGRLPTPWGEVREMVIADECLLPLRHPGEDATDETLLYRHVKPPFMLEPA